jgi:hypothetical protein
MFKQIKYGRQAKFFKVGEYGSRKKAIKTQGQNTPVGNSPEFAAVPYNENKDADADKQHNHFIFFKQYKFSRMTVIQGKIYMDSPANFPSSPNA